MSHKFPSHPPRLVEGGAHLGMTARYRPRTSPIKMAKAANQTASPILPADKAAALALTPVSRETEARLDRYVDLLREWQAKTNLVAPSTLPNLWTRHIADSDRKSTRLNSSHIQKSRMPSSA